MGQFEDVKWPPEYRELTLIEELLHCRICYEYIDTSIITPCSHNYCSICIRKFLRYKTQCPVCFENIQEKDLHANRILDEFKSYYLTLREKLFSCIKGVEVDRIVEKPADLTPVKPITPSLRTSQFSGTRKQLFQEKKIGLTVLSPEKINSRETLPPKTPAKGVTTPSTSYNTPRINPIFSKSGEKVLNDNTNGKKVPCPVCGIEISDSKINRHLDDCLKRQNSMPPTKNANSTLQPLPKYVLYLMKDPELRNTLRTYGLSASGVRKVLKKRLQRFSMLYNVERDKLVPRTIQEIAKQCELEEIAEQNIPKPNLTDNMFNVDRNTDSRVIEKAHKQYLEKHKDDYKKLIETINGRSSTSQTMFGEGTSSTSQNATSQSILNESETNSSFFDLSQDSPVDSDSAETSCPLQHYSRDDPTKFLILELLPSDSNDSPLKFDTSNTTKRSSTESKASPGSDKLVASPTKTRRSSSGRKESPPRFSNESRDSLRSKNSQGKITSPLKKENGSDPSASSMTFSFGSKSSTNVGELEAKKASVMDIFEASTEDNWSDAIPRESTGNKGKKLVKRSKFDLTLDSSDSETDFEYGGVRSVGRKTKKQKQRNKKLAKNDGSSRPKEPAVGSQAPSGSLEVNKENSEEFEAKQTRRSTRKRTLVSPYASIPGKGGKKVLDEKAVNVIIDVDHDEERSKDGVTREAPDRENDSSENVPGKRSLRKRRKV